MITLNSDESRVLGVLIEKATTTPDQYPLSMNAITNGSNQKSNRDPVRNMSEEQCFDATESLRAKALVVRVDQAGDRVPKFRHNAGQILQLRTSELAILAELLLRGPQTIGEIRGRASRMSVLESLESAQGLVNAMMQRTEPLVKQFPPVPGSRAVRFAQLLCPESNIDSNADSTADLHLSEEIAANLESPASAIFLRLSNLEKQVTDLRAELQQLRTDLGQ